MNIMSFIVNRQHPCADLSLKSESKVDLLLWHDTASSVTSAHSWEKIKKQKDKSVNSIKTLTRSVWEDFKAKKSFQQFQANIYGQNT